MFNRIVRLLENAEPLEHLELVNDLWYMIIRNAYRTHFHDDHNPLQRQMISAFEHYADTFDLFNLLDTVISDEDDSPEQYAVHEELSEQLYDMIEHRIASERFAEEIRGIEPEFLERLMELEIVPEVICNEVINVRPDVFRRIPLSDYSIIHDMTVRHCLTMLYPRLPLLRGHSASAA